jgi:NADPH:quinone reductase-like Zn-dependent oxidoreductase
VQFAARGGARVIAVVGSPDKAAHARAAGAHETIDRRREDVVARVRALAGEGGVERIVEVDLGANMGVDAALIAVNGTIASYSSTSVPEPVLPYYPLAFKGANLRLIQGYRLPVLAREAAIADIARLPLIHAIDSRFALDQIAAAHARVESGAAMGNVVVEIG